VSRLPAHCSDPPPPTATCTQVLLSFLQLVGSGTVSVTALCTFAVVAAASWWLSSNRSFDSALQVGPPHTSKKGLPQAGRHAWLPLLLRVLPA